MSRTTGELPPPGTVGGGERRRRGHVIVVAAAAVVVLVTTVIVVLLNGGGEGTTPTTNAPPTTAPPASAGRTPTEAPTTTERPPTTTVQASAADVLGPFLAASATLDDQLHAAATAINGGGPPWTGVSQEMADAVRAAALEPVAKTIPAGLPRDLLTSVILVYSDLSSRRHAMQSFWSAPDLPYQPIDPLAELAGGHAAAVRFDADLAVLQSLAKSTPPVTLAPPDSREAAEVQVYVRLVEVANGGCESRGGAVFTHLPALDWIPSATPAGEGIPSWDGHVAGIQFSADHNASGTWDIQLNAC
jgi:hypothetical protein